MTIDIDERLFEIKILKPKAYEKDLCKCVERLQDINKLRKYWHQHFGYEAKDEEVTADNSLVEADTEELVNLNQQEIDVNARYGRVFGNLPID